ncbi:MAG: poly(3-hydroxybutyrate) depolymerase [Proteobacteria bacterium]|nr:poly(3-hydroxybutyrate) depolymerase [Pseudomonadota bacterium]
MTLRRLAVLCAAAISAGGCSPNPDSAATLDLGSYDYGRSDRVDCSQGKRSGSAGRVNGAQAIAGIRFNLRTPSNYDATRAHPLLVVYAAATHGAAGSERFTGLTREATGRGIIVAYVESRPLSPRMIRVLAEIPGIIEKDWCIDHDRIYLTGHSDGATTSAAIVFLGNIDLVPGAIAISAPGIRQIDLAQYDCPAPLSVMITQQAHDALFPGYAAEIAAWFATCNHCKTTTRPPDGRCFDYEGCPVGGRTRFCETDGTHRQWPGLNTEMLEFLSNAPSALKPR